MMRVVRSRPGDGTGAADGKPGGSRLLRRLAAYGIAAAAAAALAATAFPTAAGAAAGAAHPTAAQPAAAQAAAAKPAAAAPAATGSWTGTWATAPQSGGSSFDQQTIRQIVDTSISGTAARIEISNAFGTAPLTVSDVHIALAGSGSAITSGTDHTVTFGGSSTTTIAAGGLGISDTIADAIPALTEVAVSFYLPDSTGASTYQQISNQTTYIASGDVSGAASLPSAQTASSYFFLTNLDVQNANSEGSVVALGASITDGYASTLNANDRWTNGLATRLNAAGDTIGVLNEGISGNRLLVDGAGQSALNRFDRDVLGQPGVRWVIFSDDPINDLGSTSPQPTSAQLIAGIQQLITEAHQAGIKFICSTLTPYQGASYWNQSGETAREAINSWIRAGNNGCDGVIDQDDATHNPADPTEYLPAYDSGDHLHPNDAGYQAIANAVNLGLFTPPTAYSNLAASYNDVGITADNNTDPGNWDGNGASFSETALTNAGAGPGASVSSGGVTYTMPSAAAGTDDNTVAEGQTIDLSGSGTSLGFLLSASYGPATGSGTITYTDGSTSSYTITSSDWFSTTPQTGDTLAISSAYQNRQGNTTYSGSGNIFAETVPLTAGKTVASVTLPAGGALTPGPPTLHILALALASSSGAPYGGTPAAVPGTVLAANYDTGGQGVAYNVTSVNGTGNSYRPDGVDLETCTDTGCGYDIGWTATGQWFKYTVDVATAGTYAVSLQLASPSGTTDALHIANAGGTNLSGSINAPDTGGWQTWAAATATVTLPAGVQTLTLDQDNAGWNVYDLTLTAG
jgi:lysophospholipase L1-like esterase